MDSKERGSSPKESPDGLLTLAAVALLAGAAAGFLAALFRLALTEADGVRERLLAWAGPLGAPGWLAVISAAAAATALAAALVRRGAPLAGGSGIPHVEAVVRGELPPAPLGLVVV
jgi:CIC family chloride channel protein